jgi:hypothetical protein
MVKVTIAFKAETKLNLEELWEIEKNLLEYIQDDTLKISQVELTN